MLHDYHLYLTGGTVKKRLPASVVQHFIHIPWPTPQYFTIMPSAMRTAILESLCSCDIVGFHTGWDARNFLLCCESLLKGTKIDLESMSIDFNGHRVLIRQYPVSIDATTLVQFAASSEVLDYEKKLRSISAGKTIVRVDRLEPTKNIIRGFRAYELLLGRHPELIGKVTFLAFLVPSRTDIWEYQRYSAEVLAIIQRINSNFRRPDWQPIQLFHQENYAQAIAGMKLADVLVVNPLVDGMNLVAKEGPMVNNRHAALVLSERAGAHEQLGSHSLTVSPVDIEGTAKAIYAGLNLDVEERISRSDSLQGSIRNQDIIDWIERQLIDLLPLI